MQKSGGTALSKPVTIDWEPANWFAATWRELPPLIRPAARPFDIASARTNYENLIINWPAAPIELSLSPEEAVFWFCSCFGKGLGDFSMLDELSSHLKNGKLDSETMKIDLETMKGLLKKTRFAPDRAHGLVPIQILSTLMEDEALIDLLSECTTMVSVHTQYRKYVLPFLSVEKKLALQKRVQKFLKSPFEGAASFSHYLAAVLGMHEATLSLVEGWSDTHPQRADMHARNLQLILFGLGSAELVAKHFKRLNLKLTDREHVVSWLAHTEDSELDLVKRSVIRAAASVNTDEMMRVVCCLNSLPTAEFMCNLFIDNSFYKDVAANWLQSHSDLAVEALINLSAHPGAKADSALRQLRIMKRHLGEAKIRAISERMSANAVKRVNEELLEPYGKNLTAFDKSSTPDWLSLALAAQANKTGKKIKFPSWLVVADMTPVVVGEHRLNDSQVETLLCALQESTLDQPAPLLLALRRHGNAKALDHFVWLVFETWLANEGKAKENWAMFAVGLLGSDALAPKLSRLIREWPGESNHKRSVVGLDCLRVMGSDIALMQINGIAEKVQFKALKAKADECMAAIASAKQMSQDRLSDRIIPSLGFESSGEQIFDYGERQFVIKLGADLKPVIYDENGKVRAELPAANANDDTELAQKAQSEFKALKKALKDLEKVQITRLEHGMVTGRRWFADEFVNFLVNHPVMQFLLRDYVFGGFNMLGQLTGTFVIRDKDNFQNIDGQPVSLLDFGEISLLHPLQLSDADLNKWKNIFTTNKIKQPFPQLERPVQRLMEREVNDFEVLRLAKLRIPAVVIVGTLDRHGWQRGPVMDGGLYTEHIRYFPRQDVTALIQYDGIPTGTGGVDWADQYINHCLFLSGKVAGDYDRDFQKGLQLGTIDPVVLSEVLCDVELLKAKGSPD